MSEQYLITETQMRIIMRLADAANLLTAGLPPSYTTTPIGPLKQLSDDVAAIAFTAPTLAKWEQDRRIDAALRGPLDEGR